MTIIGSTVRHAVALFDLAYVFTPITVDWVRYKVEETGGTLAGTRYVITWRSLYVFGIRIATWRASDD